MTNVSGRPTSKRTISVVGQRAAPKFVVPQGDSPLAEGEFVGLDVQRGIVAVAERLQLGRAVSAAVNAEGRALPPGYS